MQNKEKMLETYEDYLTQRIEYEKRMKELSAEGFALEIEALEKHLEAWKRKIQMAKTKEVECTK
uniref:Uncharacterized protein n=1 Tax=viral metagenome TaxID=1070528 RepID=A0A6M3JIG1_9ZZZZ